MATKDWIDNIVSAWTGHRRFAEWLVKELGARSAIELGVDRGYSLFTFANAGIEKIYGIDLWEPDPSFPEFGYDNYLPLLENLAEMHGLTNRISFIRGRFEEVVKTWSHGKVDVLHIDGTHIYEHVKCDFESWWPFVNDGGVVLMHDVCIPHFTVKQYFNEIPFPKAWFAHSAGLGIVCRDASVLAKIKDAFPEVTLGNVA